MGVCSTVDCVFAYSAKELRVAHPMLATHELHDTGLPHGHYDGDDDVRKGGGANLCGMCF
jgi:hypothetical protein